MPNDETVEPHFSELWDYGDPEGSEKAFRKQLDATTEPGTFGYRAELLTQIARAQGLQRKFSEAHKTLDTVKPMLDNTHEDMSGAKARYLLERGRVFNSSGDKAAAIPLFEQAWNETSPYLNHLAYFAVDAAHMLGIAEEPDAALVWNEKAIAHAELRVDTESWKWLGSLYNNTGWTYHEKGEFTRALELFEKALTWFKEHGNESQIQIARYTIGRCYRSLNRLDDALVIQQKLEKELAKAGEPDGYVYEELGELLLAKQEPGEARPHFLKAYELLSKDEWLKANEADRLARLKKLGSE